MGRKRGAGRWRRFSASILALIPAAGVAQDAVPTRRIVDVGPSAGFIEPAGVPRAVAAKAAGLTLPVLIPAEFARYRSLDIVSTGPYDYTASVRATGAKLSISGTRQATDPPPGSATATPVDAPADAGFAAPETDEPILVSLSFEQGGPGYVLTAECDGPRDRRCTDAYLKTLRGSLRLVQPPAWAASPAAAPSPDPAAGFVAPPVPSAAALTVPFEFKPAGELLPGSGKGSRDGTIFAPGIRFPVATRSPDTPPRPVASYANSQVWMKGGSQGTPGSWKDRSNFQYPWRDNFCEARARKTPSCPSGAGHQGQDIRVVDGNKDRYWAVATEDGAISNVGLYSVELTGRSGNRYRYLHLAMARLAVRQGASVRAGDRIGLVSDNFGGTPTPVHLHFEILQNVGGRGLRHVPPYMSLVRAYQRDMTGQ